MRGVLEFTRRHLAAALASGASLALVAGGWLWAWFALRGAAEPLIIHFNDAVGIDRIGSAGEVMWFGALSAIIVLLNSLLALELDRRDWFWGKFAAGATFGLAGLLFIAFAAIISVN